VPWASPCTYNQLWSITNFRLILKVEEEQIRRRNLQSRRSHSAPTPSPNTPRLFYERNTYSLCVTSQGSNKSPSGRSINSRLLTDRRHLREHQSWPIAPRYRGREDLTTYLGLVHGLETQSTFHNN
jgi:hypothetical protein